MYFNLSKIHDSLQVGSDCQQYGNFYEHSIYKFVDKIIHSWPEPERAFPALKLRWCLISLKCNQCSSHNNHNMKQWNYSPQSNSNAKLPDRLIIKWNLQSFVSGDQAVSTFKRWIAERRLRLDNCNDVHVEFQWINNLVYKLLSCVQWPIHHPSDLIWS